jgi:hypothetical protein
MPANVSDPRVTGTSRSPNGPSSEWRTIRPVLVGTEHLARFSSIYTAKQSFGCTKHSFTVH